MHKNVYKLDLSKQGITEITEQEGQLLAKNYPNVDYLNLSTNKLRSLPKTFRLRKSVLSLNLDSNLLNPLPKALWNQTSLVILSLRENGLESVPKEIMNLKSLKRLRLAHN